MAWPNKPKEFCKRGHLMSEARINKRGHRICIPCMKLRNSLDYKKRAWALKQKQDEEMDRKALEMLRRDHIR